MQPVIRDTISYQFDRFPISNQPEHIQTKCMLNVRYIGFPKLFLANYYASALVLWHRRKDEWLDKFNIGYSLTGKKNT